MKKRKTKKTLPAGKGFVRLLFWYITNNFYHFVLLLLVIGIIISLFTTDIVCGKKGIKIQKKPIDITDVINSSQIKR